MEQNSRGDKVVFMLFGREGFTAQFAEGAGILVGVMVVEEGGDVFAVLNGSVGGFDGVGVGHGENALSGEGRE